MLIIAGQSTLLQLNFISSQASHLIGLAENHAVT